MGGGRRPVFFVEIGSAVETPATAPSCFVGIRVDQLMPRANGEGWAQYEGQNIVIQGNCFSKQPQKMGASQKGGDLSYASEGTQATLSSHSSFRQDKRRL